MDMSGEDLYPDWHIASLELLWGKGYLSPGGPEEVQRLLAGLDPQHAVTPRRSGVRAVDRSGMMEIVWYSHQLMRIARRGHAQPTESVLKVALCYMLSNFVKGDIGLPKFRAS